MSDTTPTAGGPEHSTKSTRTTEAADLTTAKDWFKRVLKLQHASVEQANEDRRRAAADRRADLQAFQAAIKANAARTNQLKKIIVGMHAKTDQLEEIIVGMHAKAKPSNHPGRPATEGVDLQRFRTSDGPSFAGPFLVAESFLTWIHGVEIFFKTKAVTVSLDKV
ncbi:hypothetical protein PTTG_07987 [Puccinia triticina 1-1 BBBD Race 1]|uniref:Uncharacterized protein n=1 Tax=Puccinia triticina (isolate 1-1 / race 1 (BBBD)) TaxID=630390 RepID=A0A0C4F4E7_PUCT1|nr:hypothetical protein PTTG_07987 [Puccinia triticina 1-1 BBBD Race 1]